VKARALNKTSQYVEILPASFGPKAAVMEAVSLILQKMLDLEYENRAETAEMTFSSKEWMKKFKLSLSRSQQ